MERAGSSDLYVEVQVDEVSSAKKAGNAQRARGFDPAKALGGIKNGSGGVESACTTGGDGRYENGTNFLREGNKVHIGPAAFSKENIEETMGELAKFGAFGKPETRANSGSSTSTKVKKADAAGEVTATTPSDGHVETQMVRDLESILSLSERVSNARKLDESVSGLYDITAGTDNDVGDGVPLSEHANRVAEPEYELRWTPSECSPEKLEVRVKLPKVTSIKDVSLTVHHTKQSGRTVSVSSFKYALKVSRPILRLFSPETTLFCRLLNRRCLFPKKNARRSRSSPLVPPPS